MATPPHLEKEIEKAATVILRSRYLVALVGAGMSVESGIPPFRGPGGLWTRFGEPDMRGYQRFLQDPKAWWENRLHHQASFRAEFAEAIAQAQPNPGHYALAELEAQGILKYLITQNVDNLHAEAGSKKVAEIHGNRHKLRCIECGLRLSRDHFVIDPHNLPPHCPECGGIVKDDGVMFGEPIPKATLDVCFQQTGRADCMLVLGTSGVVYPAASFPLMVHDRGGYLIEVNPYPTSLTPYCDTILQGTTGEVLPRLAAKTFELFMGLNTPRPPVP